MVKSPGVFTITLDFELCWGILSHTSVRDFEPFVSGVYSALPLMLELFKEYKICTTWATVGFLFFETTDELIRELPTRRPGYANKKLCNYNYLEEIRKNKHRKHLYHAPLLIKMIKSSPGQEVGCHTFSHFYCLEGGQDVLDFEEDLKAAIRVAKKYGIELKSIVFPRNQVNREYLSICRQMGIKTYRGYRLHWIAQAAGRWKLPLNRILCLIDAYVNTSGHNSYPLNKLPREVPVNIPSSRYLRPYLKHFRFLNALHLRRVKSELTYAAKEGLIYHLWWHPIDFGINTEENLAILRKILDHYVTLRRRYNMKSLNMSQIFAELTSGETK